MASIFTDFPNGISDVNTYLSQSNPINTQLTGSVADIGRLSISAKLDSNLKEIICSLLAGRGLKLPNIQICISLNIQELLNLPNLQAALSSALTRLQTAFNSFLDHTKIESVLGRISSVLGEITNIANMINFCSTPINPKAIPSVLENSMQSFLGGGDSILGKIGSVIPGQIGGCLTPGSFNCGAFSDGILGTICDNITDIEGGVVDDSIIDTIVADVDVVVTEITDLIEVETNVTGIYDQGGSELAEDARDTNDGMGVLHNSSDAGIQGNTRIASQLKALYDNLGSYQVVSSDGTVFNNIFETFVDADLLRLLRRTSEPTPQISEQVPVYNYCGEIIGYTSSVSQEEQETSVGTVPGTISQPGFNAGGLSTDPLSETGTEATSSTNSVTIVSSTTSFAGTTTTTDSTLTEILFDEFRRFPIEGDAWLIELTVTAKQTNGTNVIAMKSSGIIDNEGGILTLNGFTGNDITYNSTPATSNYDLTLDIVFNEFRVQVNGEVGHDVKWAIDYKFYKV